MKALIIFGLIFLLALIAAFVFNTPLIPVGIILVGSILAVLWYKRWAKYEQNDNTGGRRG